MKSRPLYDAVIDALMFLELSDDSVVDPDAAIGIMESIAAHLRDMDAGERRELAAYARELAMRSEDPKQGEFLRDLPHSLGVEV
jgi:hypothetical protein